MKELSPEAVRMLVRARELLQRGWCQHRGQEGDRYCLWGAARQAWMEAGATNALQKEVCHIVNSSTSPRRMADWNDAPGRTQADVLRLLDGILARVRK